MKRLEIILIRHGETDYNKEGRFAGKTDIGLNSTGKKQVKNIRKKLKNEKIDLVYSSNMKRCMETASILNFDVEVTYSKNLQEMNFGRWEGLTFSKVEKNYPKEVEEWKRDWVNFSMPNGECFNNMSKRVIDEFERIKNTESSNILIVTHGGCVRTILGHYIIGSIEESWKFYVDNGSASRLCFDDGYVYLKSLNER